MSLRKVGNQVRVVSYYSPEAIEQLKHLSASTRIQQTVYLREALDDLLKKHADALEPKRQSKAKKISE
jgi:hypothetical protein